MAGIYVHIPFCKQKCAYCNFFSKPFNAEQSKPFISALLEEIKHFSSDITEEVETIYIGGGTPSLLSVADLKLIFDQIFQCFTIAANPEITLEANPESLTLAYLQALLQETPVNRLSIGVQSFFEDDLIYLNRKHSPEQAVQAIKAAQKLGLNNISIDLIYGIPTLSDRKWKLNLEKFFDLNIPHLSCYALTVEPGTILDKQIRKGLTEEPQEEQAERQFRLLLETLKAHDYEPYEVSNFCKNQAYSRHNANYWKNKPYLGFGPAAHSFLTDKRRWNIADTDAYIRLIQNGEKTFEEEILTADMQYNEYVMTAIRTSWGISKDYVKDTFGEEKLAYLDKQIKTIPAAWIENNDKVLKASLSGILFADRIAVYLFV